MSEHVTQLHLGPGSVVGRHPSPPTLVGVANGEADAVNDVKLFRVVNGAVVELARSAIALERSLQSLLEANLEAVLGVRFLATEYPTGATHAGRIDTIGLDENSCPVVIKYKRSPNENVINQGLYYLDWLLENRAEFTLRCVRALGPDVCDRIDWSARRLICIASDFTKYDEHAVEQISRSIELVRYRAYADGFMVLELVNASAATSVDPPRTGVPLAPPREADKTVRGCLEQAPDHLHTLYRAFDDFVFHLGEDVIRRTLKYYVVYRRAKNFACLEVHPQEQKLVIFVKTNPAEVALVPGFTRNVRKISHMGTGDLEITLTSLEDLQRAKPLIIDSYDAS